MNKIDQDYVESLFDLINNISVYLPKSLQWIKVDVMALIAFLIMSYIVLSLFDKILKLDVVKSTSKSVFFIFKKAEEEAFSEPELKGLVTELQPSMQKFIFLSLFVLCLIMGIIFLVYSFIFLYPLLVLPYQNAIYGIWSYLIVGFIGFFVLFYSRLNFGMAHQLLKLKKKVDSST